MTQLTTSKLALDQLDVDALVIGVYSDAPLPPAAQAADALMGGVISRLLEQGEIRGKRHSSAKLLAPTGLQTPLLLVVGLGERASVDQGLAFRSASLAARQLSQRKRTRVAIRLDDNWSQPLQQAAMCGALSGCQGQDLYRQEKNRHAFEEIVWGDCQAKDLAAGQTMGSGVLLTRRLVNEPAQVLDPVSFAQQATELGRAAGLDVEVWGEAELQSANCGAMLAVARGSAKPARLVILRHQQAPLADAPTLALVGKGVTFDAGGLSLKPSDGMKTMKCDMAGAATVLGAMQIIAQRKLPINVVGYLGLVENMPGGNAFRLGDVLTAHNGKTIEVLNTDAEGRLVLADVLSLAVAHGATRLVDLATLTGACVVALGTDVVGVMSNQQAWCDEVLTAAQQSGEAVWQLPMFEEYGVQIKSEVADLKNIGAGRWGGAITAAKFLEEFVDKTPWVHLDIAGPAFLERAKPWQDGGGTGVMVRTLVQLAQQWNTPHSPLER